MGLPDGYAYISIFSKPRGTLGKAFQLVAAVLYLSQLALSFGIMGKQALAVCVNRFVQVRENTG
jgi:hypothetical protein